MIASMSASSPRGLHWAGGAAAEQEAEAEAAATWLVNRVKGLLIPLSAVDLVLGCIDAASSDGLGCSLLPCEISELLQKELGYLLSVP